MFTPSELEQIPLEIQRLMIELSMNIMSDVIDRINMINSISRTADYEIYQLSRIGLSSETIRKAIQDKLKLADAEIDRIYDEIIQEGYAQNKRLYDSVEVPHTPYRENAPLQQLVEAVRRQTKTEMENITRTTGFAIDMNGKTVYTPMAEYFQRTLDGAMMDITTGAFDYNKTVKKAIQEMTKSGVRSVDYESGHSNRIEVATRRAVMTGVTQVTSQITQMNMDALGTNYVEVSWHATARTGEGINNHQGWQGRVYHWNRMGDRKPEEEYSDFIEATGYGELLGLCGVNCYHSYHAFIPGISTRLYTDEQLDKMNAKENTPKKYKEKEYTSYEATQRQRQLETLMRKQRQDIKLLERANASDDDIINAKIHYRETMRQYKEFSEKMGLPQQRERIYADGLGRVSGGKGLAKPPQSSIIRDDKQFGKKIGKHAKDYGLNPSKQTDRNKMSRIIDDIITNKDEVVKGSWRGQDGDAQFYIKGSDVVVVNKGKFVTILKGGIENARIKNARGRKV